MSNSWSYELFFREENSIKDRIHNFFEVMKSNEIIYTNRKDNQIEIDVANSKGYQELKFKNVDSAVEFLIQEGGRVDVRKILDQELDWDFDFGIHFDRHPSLLIEPNNLSQKPSEINQITISIGAHLYRQESAEDQDPITIACFMKKLFGDFCTSQDAIYGFSTDEYICEDYIDSFPRIVPSVISKSAPPILFWLNYFSNEYLSVINPKIIPSLNGRFENLAKGAFVTFFDFPWEVKYQNLKKINDQWKELTA